MILKEPPEPIYWKKQSETSNQSDIKNDILSIWLGNKLHSYLWKEAGWSQPLKEKGYKWQHFLRILSLHQKELIKWHHNKITWKELLQEIKNTLNDPTFHYFRSTKSL